MLMSFRYPAETIRVDVSGKRFDRMCSARKSLLHVQMGGVANSPNNGEQEDGVDSGGDTLKRRSRSKKPRGKRRNTIAGTDGKEIEEAANGYIFGFILNNFYFTFVKIKKKLKKERIKYIDLILKACYLHENILCLTFFLYCFPVCLFDL